jgi:outer membrane usher protein
VSDTFGLVQIPGVSGATLEGIDSTTGWNGYAVVPYLRPYRINQINIKGNLGSDVELEDNNAITFIPRQGTVSSASFKVNTGRRVEFELLTSDQKKVPFGALVEKMSGETLGMVDPHGRAMLMLPEDKGDLRLRWGQEQCIVNYQLPPKETSLYFERSTASCTAL